MGRSSPIKVGKTKENQNKKNSAARTPKLNQKHRF